MKMCRTVFEYKGKTDDGKKIMFGFLLSVYSIKKQNMILLLKNKISRLENSFWDLGGKIFLVLKLIAQIYCSTIFFLF